MRWGRSTIATLLVAAVVQVPLRAQPGDGMHLLVNARIWTGDSARPWAEALAVHNGRVVAVGSRADVARVAGSGARVEDLDGRFVTPGFIDTHTHFQYAGSLLLGANLLDVSDDDRFRTRVREAHGRLPSGAWMLGGDWGAYDLDSEWQPRRELLDAIVADRPTLLNKWDRSAYIASSSALRAAGLDPSAHGDVLTPEVAARVRQAVSPPSVERQIPLPAPPERNSQAVRWLSHIAA